MNRYIFTISAFFLFSAFGSSAQSTEINRLTFLTTSDFPYQTTEGTGATYEILETIFSSLNYSMDQIEFLPWARAFAMTEVVLEIWTVC